MIEARELGWHAVFGEDLATDIGRRHGAPVQMMQLNHGTFDEAHISVIAFETSRAALQRGLGKASIVTTQRYARPTDEAVLQEARRLSNVRP